MGNKFTVLKKILKGEAVYILVPNDTAILVLIPATQIITLLI